WTLFANSVPTMIVEKVPVSVNGLVNEIHDPLNTQKFLSAISIVNASLFTIQIPSELLYIRTIQIINEINPMTSTLSTNVVFLKAFRNSWSSPWAANFQRSSFEMMEKACLLPMNTPHARVIVAMMS